jgi:hypothetical protein
LLKQHETERERERGEEERVRATDVREIAERLEQD